MKEATFAPFYACLYPGLCDIARNMGYALAIHGSMVRDLDLIAIPWIENCSDEEILVAAVKERINALLYPELLIRDGVSEEHAKQIIKSIDSDPQLKLHGRKCWSLHLYQGVYVDFSIMPRSPETTLKSP